jgi:hypothetical protein
MKEKEEKLRNILSARIQACALTFLQHEYRDVHSHSYSTNTGMCTHILTTRIQACALTFLQHEYRHVHSHSLSISSKTVKVTEKSVLVITCVLFLCIAQSV